MSDLLLLTCGAIARYGSGDRYSHDYCDSMPHGHAGLHIHRPNAAEFTAGVVSAIEAQGFRVVPAEPDERVCQGAHMVGPPEFWTMRPHDYAHCHGDATTERHLADCSHPGHV